MQPRLDLLILTQGATTASAAAAGAVEAAAVAGVADEILERPSLALRFSHVSLSQVKGMLMIVSLDGRAFTDHNDRACREWTSLSSHSCQSQGNG